MYIHSNIFRTYIPQCPSGVVGVLMLSVIRACTTLAFPSLKLLCPACQLLQGRMSDKNRYCVRFDGCACVLSHVNEWVCSCFGFVACNHDACISCF